MPYYTLLYLVHVNSKYTSELYCLQSTRELYYKPNFAPTVRCATYSAILSYLSYRLGVPCETIFANPCRCKNSRIGSPKYISFDVISHCGTASSSILGYLGTTALLALLSSLVLVFSIIALLWYINKLLGSQTDASQICIESI